MSSSRYHTKTQGWANQSCKPQIISLSGYYSPAGSTTLVSINGNNFSSFSVVVFGAFRPTVYFINSNILQFYIPSTLNSGTFPLQIFNGSIASNVVNYIIDNASGYWILNPNGSISNTNNNQTSLVSVGSFSRGPPINIMNSTYIIKKTDNWIICNTSSGSITITLPFGPDFIGRELFFKNIGTNSVNSSLNNVIPLIGGSCSYSILSSGGGQWATLVYDGNIWIVMQGS